MEKRKLNNEGFSLIELIIVIAIMAILVGALAPQLLKYVEKSKVSTDIQLAETIRTAITTAMLDPSVIDDTSNSLKTFTDGHTTYKKINDSTSFTGKYAAAVCEILGYSAVPSDINSDLVGKLKSTHGSSEIQVLIDNNNVQVKITATDKNGKKEITDAANAIEIK